jgi:Fe-S-cluster containining protein
MPMSPALRRAVLEVYREVDEAVARAGPVCQASGRCCRFQEYGHVLFLSHLEAEILLEAAPPYGTPVSADGCPFQMDGLCTAREPRPLGCRIYFCDPQYQETSHQITEQAVQRLKELAAQHDAGWLYAPLPHFLNAAGELARQPAPRRVALTVLS